MRETFVRTMVSTMVLVRMATVVGGSSKASSWLEGLPQLGRDLSFCTRSLALQMHLFLCEAPLSDSSARKSSCRRYLLFKMKQYMLIPEFFFQLTKSQIKHDA